MKSTGSKPIAENGLPVCVLPKKAPVTDHQTVGPDPDGPSEKHFHAANRTARLPPSSHQAEDVLDVARELLALPHWERFPLHIGGDLVV